MDYPNVRASPICPLCHKNKARGLLVCWACFREYEMRDGNPTAERLINEAEAELLSNRGTFILFSF